MKCPDCALGLAKLKVAGVELDTCTSCGGAWFDRDELNKLIRFGDADIERQSVDTREHADSTGPRDCPKCPDVRMAKISFLEYEGIILDYCESCGGLWLDSGELFRIEQQLEPPEERVEPPHRAKVMAFLDSLIPVMKKRRPC